MCAKQWFQRPISTVHAFSDRLSRAKKGTPLLQFVERLTAVV